MKRLIVLGLAIAALSAAVPASAHADAVSDWNFHATNALIVTAGQSPPVSVLHLAMVHGAVYDAVNAIDRGHQPYLSAPAAMPWDSRDGAAATAAYRVLANLVPAQEPGLASLYAASLAVIPGGPAKDGGIAAGEAAAAAMLAARANDGRFGPFRFPVGAAPGLWRPVLPGFVSDPFAWVMDVTPFVIDDPSEIKAKGSLASSSRTADETEAARFWAAHPPATWNRIFRSLSSDHSLTSVQNARLFAMLYVTAADALISCWTDKVRWNFWRPITAIREADTDGNPRTEAEPTWTPLIATPPYPEHPSGHGCLSGSFVETLQELFGMNKVAFSAFSPGSGTTRSFARFSDAIDEIVDARVNSGIHFRRADEHGATIGEDVARFVRKHAFRRID
jgi:hypothetical protein